MATFNQQITDTVNDVTEVAGFGTIDTNFLFGNFSGLGAAYGGARFTNVTIPAGSTINSATLDVYAVAGGQTGSPAGPLKGVLGNCAAWTTTGPVATSRTTASVTPLLGNTNILRSHNVATLVQEIVNGTWASGNAMGFVWEGTASVVVQQYVDYSTTPAQAAVLNIDYTAGGGGSVLSASGAGALAGVGRATAASVLSASGVGAASFVGRRTAASTWSASGAGALTGVGRAASASVLTAAGVGTASFVGASTFSATLSASGVGTASFVGTSSATSVLSASGAGAFSAVGLAIFASVFSSAGAGVFTAVGNGVTSSVFSMAGAGNASFLASGTITAVASWTGSGTLTAYAPSISYATATWSGAGTFNAVGSQTTNVQIVNTIAPAGGPIEPIVVGSGEIINTILPSSNQIQDT